eukprot:CAMPEP_0116559672 /NCGR_PEP_ID=MMETSP0397-20121206/10538_1 /TAXON_ID=216820 /ORGANISM="Cyclophora tenuis, Strain ECT3854" /LENGTH=158 /DNA_ID=CAMNT_0004085491 /DNA_START=48 /DNA_END=524 /DNA_ORIENTATION=-
MSSSVEGFADEEEEEVVVVADSNVEMSPMLTGDGDGVEGNIPVAVAKPVSENKKKKASRPRSTTGNARTARSTNRNRNDPNRVIPISQLGRDSAVVICPHCGELCRTVTVSVPDCCTYIWSFFLCMIFTPLAFLPCCIPDCLGVRHDCTKCGAIIKVT